MASSHTDDQTTRRDFLYVATAATGVVLTGATVWPLVDQMNPDASVRALASIEQDLSALEEGAQLTIKWRGKPVFIRKLSETEISEAAATPVDDLPDPVARNANVEDGAPADETNRTVSGEAGTFLVMMGVCTHLGCVPTANGGDYGGWYCPCHGSHYDIAGRIRKGPAPTNLPIPRVAFVDGSTIRIG